MTGDNTEETILFDIAADAGAARRGDDWPGWEQERRRIFRSANERPIDSGGRLGRVRNISMDMVMRRDGDGFAGSWSVSVDELIGPLRLDRPDTVALRLQDAQGGTVIEVTASGFAHACGGWRTLSWTGALAREQFERIATVSLATRGDVGARRC